MKLRITIDNQTYDVDVEVADDQARPAVGSLAEPAGVRVPAPAAIKPAAPAGAATTDSVCRSPVNGTVVRVVARAGQHIQPGDILLVLEAMKMETNITAPVAGTVARILVTAGDAVKSQQVLVELG